MCGRVIAVNTWEMLREMQSKVTVSSESIFNKIKEGDVSPTELAPVITHHKPREIQYMRWGLIPATATDPKLLKPMFNARAETIMQLSSFKTLVMKTRCLILNRGFYEWSKEGDDKVQWKITPATEEFFYKAGLWTTWKDDHTGELINSFTMITCDPSTSKISEVHNRMPVILNKAERRLWMHQGATEEQLLGLLKPCDDSMYSIAEYSREPLKKSKIEITMQRKQDEDKGLFDS